MKKDIMKHMALFMVLGFLAGCSSTTTSTGFNGLSTPDGQAVHLSTSNVALHLLIGKKPLSGNASLEQTVDDFTAAAKAQGATKVRIVQSSKRAWWFLFPPFTFIFTPVTSNVAGDAIK
jgi:hypothetical protein